MYDLKILLWEPKDSNSFNVSNSLLEPSLKLSGMGWLKRIEGGIVVSIKSFKELISRHKKKI